jgi:hypothetical protein
VELARDDDKTVARRTGACCLDQHIERQVRGCAVDLVDAGDLRFSDPADAT